MKFLGSIVMEREAGMGYGSSVPSGLEVSRVAEAARLHDSPRSTSVQPWPPVRFEAPPLSPGCAFAAEVALDRIPELLGERSSGAILFKRLRRRRWPLGDDELPEQDAGRRGCTGLEWTATR